MGCPPSRLGAALGVQRNVDNLQLEAHVGKLKEIIIISISFPHMGHECWDASLQQEHRNTKVNARK